MPIEADGEDRQDRGDGAGSAQARDHRLLRRRCQGHYPVQQRGREPSAEVEKAVDDRSEGIFHHASKDPEEQHVPEDVQKPGVHKGGRDDRDEVLVVDVPLCQKGTLLIALRAALRCRPSPAVPSGLRGSKLGEGAGQLSAGHGGRTRLHGVDEQLGEEDLTNRTPSCCSR